MKTITFFNNKGGVGKTTTVYHVAWMLSEMGIRSIVIDLDPQSNLTSMFLSADRLEAVYEAEEPSTVLKAIEPVITFPEGFPDSLIQEFERRTGHKVLCNKPYSGTQVLRDYGEQAMREDALIVYTSADSVFQVAAHEGLVPVQQLYQYCEIAREMLKGEFGVGRVIARPFLGDSAETFYRTTNRHDLSLKPPRATMLDLLKAAGRDVIAVGKISDIFDGEGVTEKIKTTGNTNGIAFTKALQTRDFEGLAFVNLVDFDMLYGHRRDVAGYAAAASEFDRFLADFIPGMREGDLLMVTADHGCDPSYTKTTDHTREYVPLLVCGKGVKPGTDLGTRLGFGAIAKTICQYLDVEDRKSTRLNSSHRT